MARSLRRAPPRPMSGLLVAFGVGNIAIGLLGLLCGGCGVFVTGIAMSAAGNIKEVGELYDQMDTAVPFWRVVEMGRPLVTLVISILLIIAGIGLLMRGRWARWLSIFYVMVNIPVQLIFIVYELGAVFPAMQEIARSKPGMPVAGVATPANKAIMLATVGIFVLYSVALMLGLFLPATSEALAPAPPPEEFEDDDRDDESDEFDDDE